MAAGRVASAVANARPARAVVGVKGSPQVPQVSQKGGTNRSKSLNPLTKTYEASHPAVTPAGTAAAPSAPSPLPWDSQAQAEVGEATTKEGNTIAELGANWAGRESYYGFGENGANNPYSQADLLATHHEWNERGRQNSAGAQLYAGSNVNAEREELGRYTTSYGQLLQAYESEKANKEAEETAAKHELTSVEENAQLGAIQRAQQSEPPPEEKGGEGGGGGGSNLPGLGGDPAHPQAYRAGVGAGKSKPSAPPGYHAYKGPGNQWWFAPN